MPARTGRPPKASAVKERSGAYLRNPKRRNKKEPKVQAKAPTMPANVKADQIAAKVWRRVIKHHREMGILGHTDSELIETYAINYSQWRKALENVEAFGQVVDGKINPWFRTMSTCMDKMIKLIPEMGFSPSSRSRMIAQIDEEIDVLQEFIKAGTNKN